MIFKIQVDIEKKKVLIYDRKRSYIGESPMDLSLSILLGGEPKVYVRGIVDEAGRLCIYNKVKARSW